MTTLNIAGRAWSFLADPPPCLHLATTDRQHVIWLEDAGARTWRPETSLPRWELAALRHSLGEYRRRFELAWVTQVMIPAGWVDAYLVEDDDIIVVESYAGTRNWYGTVVVPEEIHVPVASINDVTIDAATGELIIGASQVEQQRMDLAQMFWGV